ncbi:MAG: response regulator transcription factor [Chloroflexi bacterium]|nr:response regulator transcription factor [Chloroflexota bacterium]
MIRLLIIAGGKDKASALSSQLVDAGFACTVAPDIEEAAARSGDGPPDLILVALPSPRDLGRLTQRIKQEGRVPIMAVLPRDTLSSLDSTLDIDDFVAEPWDAAEVALRIRRILWRTSGLSEGEVMKYGDLVIDVAKCEVFVKGRPVVLTFKEYELLRLLASHKGKVLTRQALLNRIWGYDYYGGDRTVDVHIRRLRSKIEEQDLSFIETVRNIGYKFKAGGG